MYKSHRSKNYKRLHMLRVTASKSSRERMGFDPLNLESSKGNSYHSFQITVFVSMRDNREAWRRTRDWLI